MTTFQINPLPLALSAALGLMPVAGFASGHNVIPLPGGNPFPQVLDGPAIANDNLSIGGGHSANIPGAQPSLDPGFGLPSGGGAASGASVAASAGSPGEEGGGTGATPRPIQQAVTVGGSIQSFRVVCPVGTHPETRTARDGDGLRWVCAY